MITFGRADSTAILLPLIHEAPAEGQLGNLTHRGH